MESVNEDANGALDKAVADDGSTGPAALEALFVRRPWHKRFGTQFAALVRRLCAPGTQGCTLLHGDARPRPAFRDMTTSPDILGSVDYPSCTRSAHSNKLLAYILYSMDVRRAVLRIS